MISKHESEAKSTENSQLSNPDFERVATRYDRIQANMQPITDALLEHLPKLADGQRVLDVASGTGEPGLTLARRNHTVHVLGIDKEAAMVAVAQQKAGTEPVPNARFEVMSAEKLDLEDDSVAAVISQNGLLLFGDPVTSATEMARVLRPGGPFSLAVWDRPQLNTFTGIALRTLGEVLPPNEVPDVDWLDELATEGKREQWLRDAGMRSVYSELFHWTSHLPDLSAIRDLMEIGPFGPFFAKLDADSLAHAYACLEEIVSAYRTPDGSYAAPMALRLLWGQA